MFSIEMVGPDKADARLVSTEKLSVEDFDTLAKQLGTKPITARKVGFVAARIAEKRETIETRWNGVETTAIAEPGDRIVTNLGADKAILRDRDGHANVYVIRKAKFPELYARDMGEDGVASSEIYRTISTVEALYFAGGFEIMAPWDKMERADAGYILRNGDEVYGNNKETFEATYKATE